MNGVTGEEVTLNEKIAGIVLKDEKAAVVGRYSLTNAAKQGKDLQLGDDGGLTVDGVTYHLYALLITDKNRISNYDGYFAPGEAPPSVQVWEKENLL